MLPPLVPDEAIFCQTVRKHCVKNALKLLVNTKGKIFHSFENDFLS